MFDAAQLAKQIGIPIVFVLIGSALMLSQKTVLLGKLALFFGSNSLMNLYMKEVLSASVVSEKDDLKGFPAPFALTAIQQFVSFLLFVAWMLISSCTRHRYSPKKLRSRRDFMNVALFSLAFSGSIGLNNYSIQLLPLSVNLIIKSCLPAATIPVQMMLNWWQGKATSDARLLELILVALGVFSAILVVVSKEHGGDSHEGSIGDMTLGVLICIGALFFKATNLVLAAILGSDSKLNSFDTTLYMAIPVCVILVTPVLAYQHDLGTWPGYEDLTDWEVTCKVAELSPFTLVVVFMSGALSLFYNVISWSIVHSLSPATLAFQENFNSSATIAIGILVGLDALPVGMWSAVFVIAVTASILSFAAFSYVKISRPSQRTPELSESVVPEESTTAVDPAGVSLVPQ